MKSKKPKSLDKLLSNVSIKVVSDIEEPDLFDSPLFCTAREIVKKMIQDDPKRATCFFFKFGTISYAGSTYPYRIDVNIPGKIIDFYILPIA